MKNLLDALYRKLHSEGVGCSSSKTEALTDIDEEKLWSTGVLNPDTPQGLLNCVFFLNGKNFCLRGGVEHRNLKPSQLSREVVKINGKSLVRYTYTEFVSKNRVGGLKQLKQENKIVHQYESSDIERCHVLLLDKYLSKIPAEAKRKDIFYLKPKARAPTSPLETWYSAVPIGKNVLLGLMKTMASEAGIGRRLTNYSLRAYGITKMFQENVPEKLIMDKSGHRSIEGVRQYARISEEQQYGVCQALQNRTNQICQYQGKSHDQEQLPKQPPLQQPVSLQPAIHTQPVMFQGCSFSNCTIQMAMPPPNPVIEEPSITEDYTSFDIQELLDF